MKNYIAILFTICTLLLATGCSQGPKAPKFIKLKNVKIKSVNRSNVVLSGDAIFNNSNPLSGKLTKTDIHITINDVSIADISQNVSIDVPKNSDFHIPFNFSFNPKKLHSENKGFLKNALMSFLNKTINVKYSGSVTVEVLGVSFDVPVEYMEEVKVGLSYE